MCGGTIGFLLRTKVEIWGGGGGVPGDDVYIFLEPELFLQRPMLLLVACPYLNTKKNEKKTIADS